MQHSYHYYIAQNTSCNTTVLGNHADKLGSERPFHGHLSQAAHKWWCYFLIARNFSILRRALQLFDTKCYVFWEKFSHSCRVNRCFKYHKYKPCSAWRQRQEFCNFLWWLLWRSFSSYNFCKKIRLSSWYSFQNIRNWKCITIKKSIFT